MEAQERTSVANTRDELAGRKINFLTQGRGTQEERAAILRSILQDFRIFHTESGRPLPEPFKAAMLTGQLVPLGSVEFIRSCLEELSIEEPAPLDGYTILREHLCRETWKVSAQALLSPPFNEGVWFVKPVAVKLFSGFLWSAQKDGTRPSGSEEPYFHEQAGALAQILAYAPETPVWISRPIQILREDRIYVLDGRILGQARYDPSDAEIPPPDASQIQAMVARFSAFTGAPCAYSLDVGVLDDAGDQKTALIEINDAWALGLYREMADVDGYLTMLAARWREIVQSSADS